MTRVGLIPKPKKVKIKKGRVYTFASRTVVTLPAKAEIITPSGRYRMARRRIVTIPKGAKVTVPRPVPEIPAWVPLLLLFA